MNIIQPDTKELYAYIIQTHKADHIDISLQHILYALGQIKVEKGQKALEGFEKAYCVGHFKAINYVVKLAGSVDFPVKDGSRIDNPYQSDQSIFWLREIHTLMMYTLADYGIKNGTGQLYIQPGQCGVYRYTEKGNAFEMAPTPQQIPLILHHWLTDAQALDLEIKDKVDNPYGLTPAQSQRIFKMTNEMPMFFSCLQPFEDGNNRIGKLVENAFRLRWRLPWRIIHELEQDDYIKALMAYQEGPDGFKRWLRRITLT
jgi:hypothetical protein